MPYALATALLARSIISASGTHFCQRLSKTHDSVRLERLDKLIQNFISSELEPATFQLVAQCPNHYATACPHGNGVK
jgi:hypothetical protein